MENYPLLQEALIDLSLMESYKCVSTVKGWDFSTLSNWLLKRSLRRLSTTIILDDGTKDSICWGESATGAFTIRSAYNIIAGASHSTDSRPWDKIWKLRVLPCMKFLLWKLLHGKVMLNAEREQRGMTSNPFFHCFPREVEDLNHVFRHCTKVRSLWPKLCDGRHWSNTGDFETWRVQNIKAKHPSSHEAHW